MGKNYSEWELQPSDDPQAQTGLTPPQGEPSQVEERGSGRGVLRAVVALLLVVIVAVAVVLYLVVSGRDEQWLDAGAKDEAALRRTVTATAMKTVKMKPPEKTKRETMSTVTPGYPINGDCEELVFPTMEENFTIVVCDGWWALGGGVNSGGLTAYQWDEGVWQGRESDSRYTAGFDGSRFTDEHIKEHGMTVTAPGRMACSPDKLTN